MCDNSLLIITATLHLDNPTKIELPTYMYACKVIIEYLFHSHCPSPHSFNYLTVVQHLSCPTMQK